MLPSVALALAVEMLSDGGTLCASFQGTNGAQYWLLLPVRIEDHSVVGYELPVAIERPFAPEEFKLSWPHAAVLLRQIERMLPDGANRRWVDPMYEAIRREGKRVAS